MGDGNPSAEPMAAKSELIAAEVPLPLARDAVEVGVAAATSRERALVEARFVVAHGRPRDIMLVRDRLLGDCRRRRFAERARYRKPMGDTQVTGFSIRFTEAALSAYGNVDVQSTITYEDDERRICRVSVTDLERNTGYWADVIVAKTVERRRLREGQVAISERTNSQGKTVYLVAATEEDVLAKMNSGISKAIRNCGLRLLPADILEEAEEVCAATMLTEAKRNPEQEKRAIFDAFALLGVRAADLQAYIGHDASTLAPAEILELREVYAAVRDGEIAWHEAQQRRAEQHGEKDASAREADLCGDEEILAIEAAIADRMQTLDVLGYDVWSAVAPRGVAEPRQLPKADLPALLKRIAKWEPPPAAKAPEKGKK